MNSYDKVMCTVTIHIEYDIIQPLQLSKAYLYASFRLGLNSFGITWLVKITAGGTPVPVGSLSILSFKAFTNWGQLFVVTSLFVGGPTGILLFPFFLQQE